MTTEIEIISPDDWHHHLRDGPVLKDVVAFASSSFQRVIVMPNIKPPVRTLEEALSYKERILSHLPSSPSSSSFTPLMTLYLTDYTTPEEIFKAKESNIIVAAKLYPAGATTNSEMGVTSIAKIDHVLAAMSQCGMLLLGR